ncbi:MAG: ATP-binding cassette domain-containing protein [Gammaproteobacteria bacterium]
MTAAAQRSEHGPATTPSTTLGFANVSKRFRSGKRSVEALQDVTVNLRPATVTGLIGPDGAGKTTLMRLAAGLLAPDSGNITVLDRDATRDSLVVQASIGYMPQRFGLYEDLSVQENLDLYANLQGVPTELRTGRYAELMHMTGLGPFTRRLAGQLSGGMKQKLGLACTLVQPPRLLLLDEPTVGVDPVSRRELWSIVYRLVREEGMSVLLSTAYLDEAERCGEVILLNDGRLLGHGPPGEFSAELKGRTFVVEATDGLARRTLQARLSARAEVSDAVIQGERVRLVLDEGADAKAVVAGIGDGALHPEAVEPRFEDAFITRVRAARGRTAHAHAETGSIGQTQDDSEAAGTHDTGANAEPVIEVRDLERRFGDFYAVHHVSFAVQPGEVFGLLGANGAGKTTTFRMLCGLLPPSGGEVSVAGVDLRRAAAKARARIGYMSQKFSLYGHLSVLQNLRFFSGAYGLRGTYREQRMRWALDEFELGNVADANSQDLSLGYKQRLALACALMHEPEILFLDEPTSGVDPLARREFWSRINELAHAGVTVLVTTHFMEEAEYCDRLAIMVAGEILALGTPSAIRQQAAEGDEAVESMEDAFIHLIEQAEATGGSGS